MSDSASVYEPDDTESESDLDQVRPSREPSPPQQPLSKQRSPAKQGSPRKKPGRNEHNRKNAATSSSNAVDQQLGEVLAARVPPMRGSLTFLRAYKHLFAESQEAAAHATLEDRQNIYEVSQLGSVVWTSTEKQVFFNVLDRKGKGGIREIAAAIGTKSELEVIEYIRFLHKALEGHYISEKHVERMPVLSDIPAAMEVSQECCELLDEFGDILVFQENFHETEAGRKIHGDNWIITNTEAQDLVNPDDTVRGDLRLAAEMFNVPDWVRLSQVLFMNFGGSKAQNNWHWFATGQDQIISEGQSVSMTAESLVDFYALAVSVTRRLVQSAIFFSMSRVRSASRSGRDRKRHVRMQDVRAAVEVLNMKHRRPNFVDVARRNELTIKDIHNRKGWVSSVFSYDEAEEIIDKNEWFRYRKDGTRSRKRHFEEVSDEEAEDEEEDDDGEMEESHPATEPEPESDVESEPLSEVDNDDNQSLRTHDSSELSSHLGPSDELEMELDPEEQQAENADLHASCRHEANIRRLMDQPLPSTLEQNLKAEEAEAESKQQYERRNRQGIMEWRDRTLYRSEWEEYGYDLADLKEELDMPPQKKRRVSDATPVLSAPSPMTRALSPGNKGKQGELQPAKQDQGVQGPSDGQSWLDYYMTQFGKASTQQPK